MSNSEILPIVQTITYVKKTKFGYKVRTFELLPGGEERLLDSSETIDNRPVVRIVSVSLTPSEFPHDIQVTGMDAIPDTIRRKD